MMINIAPCTKTYAKKKKLYLLIMQCIIFNSRFMFIYGVNIRQSIQPTALLFAPKNETINLHLIFEKDFDVYDLSRCTWKRRWHVHRKR